MLKTKNQATKSHKMSHKRNNEDKMKNRNRWNEQPNRKLDENEALNNQLKRQQDKWGCEDNFKPVFFFLLLFFYEKISRAQKRSQANIN